MCVVYKTKLHLCLKAYSRMSVQAILSMNTVTTTTLCKVTTRVNNSLVGIIFSKVNKLLYGCVVVFSVMWIEWLNCAERNKNVNRHWTFDNYYWTEVTRSDIPPFNWGGDQTLHSCISNAYHRCPSTFHLNHCNRKISIVNLATTTYIARAPKRELRHSVVVMLPVLWRTATSLVLDTTCQVASTFLENYDSPRTLALMLQLPFIDEFQSQKLHAPGIEPGTFWLWIRRNFHWTIRADVTLRAWVK